MIPIYIHYSIHFILDRAYSHQRRYASGLSEEAW